MIAPSQPTSGTKGSAPEQKPRVASLSISLLKGHGDKSPTNSATGGGSMAAPLPTSPGRSAFQSQPQAFYDSGSGNISLGTVWDCNFAATALKAKRGLLRNRPVIQPAESGICHLKWAALEEVFAQSEFLMFLPEAASLRVRQTGPIEKAQTYACA